MTLKKCANFYSFLKFCLPRINKTYFTLENAGDERPEYLTHSLQFFFHAKNFKYKNQTPVNVSVVQIKKEITKFGDKNFVSLTRDDRFVKLDEKNEKNASGTSKFFCASKAK